MLLVSPQQWGSSTQVCANLEVQSAPQQPVQYAIVEAPIGSSRTMLALTDQSSTGVLDPSNPRICVPTKPTEPFPLRSEVFITFFTQGAPVKQATLNLAPAVVLADNIKVRTDVDRINGLACPAGTDLVFDLLQDAEVTIKVDGQVIQANDVLQQSIPRAAGRYRVPITPALVSLPGEHDFEITGVFKLAGAPDVTSGTTGKIVHEVVLNASFPIGHTMIKGVDLWDGHLTHSAQDVLIPGRGLALDFTRSYSSAGNASDGPLGAGWTHSYQSRLVQDSCGRFVVIGGEGTGNAFAFDGTAFRPQIGYHSTLIRDPQDSGKFDFYTKARVRYHFEREPMIPGEVYTLRFIEEPNGNRITLDYVGGDGDPTTLDAVTDSSGRSLVFEYQQIGQFAVGPRKRLVKLRGRNALTGGNLLGLEITYEYDTFGNLIKVTRKSPDPGAALNDERVQIYAYETSNPLDRHNLRFYTDPNGNTTEYVYYAATDQIPGIFAFGLRPEEVIKSIRQPESVITNLTYDFPNRTRTVSDPRSPQEPIPPTIYTVNNYGATVKIEAPLGKTTVMEWCTDAPSPACPDQSGNPGRDILMISKVDAEGRTELYEYGDRLGNRTRETILFTGNKAPVTLKDGITPVPQVSTGFSYEPTFSKMTSKTDAEGNTTVFLIDATYLGKPNFCPDPSPNRDTGNLLGIRDAEGNVTCYSYAPNGDLVSITDPRGFMTSYTQYDVYGNREKIQDPVGNVTTNVFDERSRLSDTFDTFTHHARFAYDGLDRKIQEERLDDLGAQGTPQVMAYRYKANGEPDRVMDGLGHSTRYFYDGLNRNIEKREENILQADGSTIVLSSIYAYDQQSNMRTETDPRAVSRIHTYDALNRRTHTKVQGPYTPDEVILVNTYDLVGNKLSQTDLHGHTTTHHYDGLYRIVETDLPFPNAIIRTAFDRMGNKVLETDANGQPMRYVYDNIYRLTQKTDAVGNSLTYFYDPASNKVREQSLSSGLLTEYLEYDGLNRPRRVRQSVPLGGPGLTTAVYETHFEYEDSDNAVILTNPRGFKTRTDRDGLNRVVQTVVDLGGLNLTTTYTYDANGNVRTVQDPEGGDSDVTHEYDGLNRRIRSTYVATSDDGGQPVTEEFSYDGNSNLTRFKDKRGIVFSTIHDNLNRELAKNLTESISNGGSQLTLVAYTYDDANSSFTTRDANGNVTTTHADGLHRPRIIDDPDPNAAYDPAGAGPFPVGLLVVDYDGVNKRAETDKKGHRKEYDYDAINRLKETREYDLAGVLRTKTQAQYLDQQNLKRETDRRGIVTIYQFDALQRLIQLRRSGLDMASHYGSDEVLLETHEYDGTGNKTAFMDAQGNRTEYTYDGANRQITATAGAGAAVAATTRATYDNVGNVLTVKDGRQHGGAFDMRYVYDARYRRVSATNGELETTTYAYDGNNNVVRKTEPGGPAFTTIYKYDELNKLLTVDETPRISASTTAGVTRFFYDGNRNKIAQQDANGHLTTYRYDGLDRLTDTFQHTEAGCLSDQTARGPSPTGNPACGSEATALRWRYGYDLNGNQNLIVDAKSQRVSMTHDHLNRLLTKAYDQHAVPDLDFEARSIGYAYDGNGNLTSVTETKRVGGADVTEVTLSSYDPLDRLQTRTHRDHDDPVGKRVEYDYDVQGNRIAVKDPDGVITTYTYDARNRLQTVTTEAGVTTYAYWEDSLPRKVEYPNGTISDRSDPSAYDRADRIRQTVNRPSEPSQAPFSTYTYAYDNNGNRLSQVEVQRGLNGASPETTTYAYDNLHRLLSVSYGAAGSIAYTYAPNGNRLTERGTEPQSGQPIDRTYTYEELPGKPGVTFNRVNALTQVVDNTNPAGTVTYEYDGNLNQVARERAGLRTEFRFGIRDQLLAVRDVGATTFVTFDYDHNGMRVKKVNGGAGRETRYLYDERSVLVEYGGVAQGRNTVHKYDYGYELLSFTQVDPTGQQRDSQFYFTDGLRSTANLTDEAGALLHSYRYDAWGRIREQAGASENPRQYTSHYKDDETSLHYFGSRYYDDETGRFLSQDPYLGDQLTPPSLHRYLYAYANPVRFIDLTGYKAEEAKPAIPGGEDAIAGQCLGSLCLRGSDNTWVSQGEEVVPKNPCEGIAGPCNPRTRDVDEYVIGENARYTDRIRQEAQKDRTSFEVHMLNVRRNLDYRLQTDLMRISKEYEQVIDPTAETGYGWAGTVARKWEKLARETESALEEWVGENPSMLKTLTATALMTAVDLGAGTVDALRLGEGAAEGGLAGVGNDVLRAVDIVSTVAPMFLVARALVVPGEAATVAVASARASRIAEARRLLGSEAETAAREMMRRDTAHALYRAGSRTGLEKMRAVGRAEEALREGRFVFSGHGEWTQAMGTTRVPEGTWITFYSKHGEKISDALGNQIELFPDLQGGYRMTYGPGDEIPNYILSEPTKLKIQGNPVTVTQPTNLDELMRPHMGRIDWAACRAVRK
jgi:RHS repeat-associated protein